MSYTIYARSEFVDDRLFLQLIDSAEIFSKSDHRTKLPRDKGNGLWWPNYTRELVLTKAGYEKLCKTLISNLVPIDRQIVGATVEASATIEKAGTDLFKLNPTDKRLSILVA